jgi:RHS repeat-associated protein
VVYDGDGHRISETVGGTTTKYLVDSLNPTGFPQVIDELVSGAVTRTYAYGLQRVSENQKIGTTPTASFYGYDGHGNVRFLTGSAGTATDTYVYDAFGMPITTTGTTPNSFLYSGEQFDSALGLYYLRARYYNPATGRLETMDPAPGSIFNPSTLHKYVFTGNNPVNWVDPTGRDVAEYDTITFSEQNSELHGIRHFACSLLSETAIVDAITQAVLQVAGSGADIGGEFWGMVQGDYTNIIYRAFPRPGTGCINVGTFYPYP